MWQQLTPLQAALHETEFVSWHFLTEKKVASHLQLRKLVHRNTQASCRSVDKDHSKYSSLPPPSSLPYQEILFNKTDTNGQGLLIMKLYFNQEALKLGT